jgi:hypothetical protein
MYIKPEDTNATVIAQEMMLKLSDSDDCFTLQDEPEEDAGAMMFTLIINNTMFNVWVKQGS